MIPVSSQPFLCRIVSKQMYHCTAFLCSLSYYPACLQASPVFGLEKPKEEHTRNGTIFSIFFVCFLLDKWTVLCSTPSSPFDAPCLISLPIGASPFRVLLSLEERFASCSLEYSHSHDTRYAHSNISHILNLMSSRSKKEKGDEK